MNNAMRLAEVPLGDWIQAVMGMGRVTGQDHSSKGEKRITSQVCARGNNTLLGST